MKRSVLSLAGVGALLLALAGPLYAQTTTDAAKADGKAFGRDKAASAQNAATTNPDASRIPNFGGTPSQSGYFDDPDRMSREAASHATTNTGYKTMRDSMDRRASFTPQDLDATIARSSVISDDPLAYTSGMAIGGSQGRCVPLPPASGTAAHYKATCNTGFTVESGIQSCTIALQASINTVTDYLYYCPRLDPECIAFDLSTCRLTGSHPGPCLQGYKEGTRFVCTEPGDPISEYTCSAPVSGISPISVTTRQVVSTSKDESQCVSLASDSNCTNLTETCTASDPATRIIDGVSVTQPCWAWRRDYQCNRYSAAQDCDTLAATPGCSLEQEYCITDEVPCRTFERVYDCPVPDQPANTNQFICDGDVYCIVGIR